MPRHFLDSSVLTWMDYDPDRRELAMQYRKSGDLYIYSHVPPDEHRNFMAAESKGEYLNTFQAPQLSIHCPEKSQLSGTTAQAIASFATGEKWQSCLHSKQLAVIAYFGGEAGSQ
jgi:hypothetical protein